MKEIGRAQVEDFLYHEAALLDAWRLDEWLELLTEDATYRVPSNDRPASDPKSARSWLRPTSRHSSRL